MRTILYTAYDPPYEPLAVRTIPTLRKHAEISGIDFRVFTEPLPNDLSVYWNGVYRGLQLLKEGWERVVWVDVDQMCTNPYATPWADVGTFGFHASKDWGEDATERWHFSMCGFVAHKDTIPLFEWVLDSEPAWRDKPFPEQAPMQHAARLWMNHQIAGPLDIVDGRIVDDSGWIKVHPRRMFNAVPKKVCPGHIVEPWKPKDWCAHLTMMTLSKRVEMFDEIDALHPR